MPCYRCGTRQIDPDRGSSPWLRGVRADRQVLICPPCQDASDWRADLDRCGVCASLHLIRRLGEVECRDCGAVGESAAGEPAVGDPAVGDSLRGASPGLIGALHDDPAAAVGLAEEVEQALTRVLRRSPRPAGV